MNAEDYCKRTFTKKGRKRFTRQWYLNEQNTMKAEDIDNMQAGGEMDILILQAVFGLEPQQCMVGGHPPGCPGNTQYMPYSTDIAAAWLVVDKMRALGLKPNIEDSDNNQWTCTFVKWTGEPLGWEYIASSIADTAPLAICRAALKAIASQQSTSLNELFHNRLTNRGKQVLANKAIEDIEQQEGASNETR